MEIAKSEVEVAQLKLTITMGMLWWIVGAAIAAAAYIGFQVGRIYQFKAIPCELLEDQDNAEVCLHLEER